MYEAAFKNIDDTLWKDAGCSSELDYIEQTSWILFLKYLDDYETDKANSALLNGEVYNSILSDEFSWTTWATPKSSDGKLDYNAALTGDDLRNYVEVGVDELDVSKLSTVLTAKYGSVHAAQQKLGTTQEVQQTFIDFQKQLYAA